jgi:biopolymer transport protein ExbB
MSVLSRFARVLPLVAVLIAVLMFQQYLSADPAATTPQAEGPVVVSASPFEGIDPELVEVNWIAEMAKGGYTIMIQLLISVALVAFVIEHCIRLRSPNIAPEKLTPEVLPMISAREYEGASAHLQKDGSLLAHALDHAINHRSANLEFLSNRVGEFGSRELEDHEQKLAVFAGIAAIAPLLGLLGTMIGMIESFKLVSVFGDEGGAAMLAGSISKALITTAFGLVIAIPAIGIHQFFKHRLHVLSLRVEREAEKVVRQIALNEAAPVKAPTREKVATH